MPNKKNKICVFAPSNSMKYIKPSMVKNGLEKLSKEFNLPVVLSQHVNNEWIHITSKLTERVHDIHHALANNTCSFLLAAYGGYNCNDLLPLLDYDLIQEANVPFVGYSDVTVLLNAIYTKTGTQSILGPSFSTFCDPNVFAESIASLKSIINCEKNIRLTAPEFCACDDWYLNDKNQSRDLYPNQEWQHFRPGEVAAKLIGGNLESFLTLLNTPYFPNCNDHILILEANAEEPPARFIRDLVHLKQTGIYDKISGLILGQFHKNSPLSNGLMLQVLQYVFSEYTYPIIYNTNFSHVDPLLSLPIGGVIKLIANETPEIIVFPD